ncbi:MAG: xanthine dehydrogenase molybdopterin binding subunit [Xanthomonadales bacterium]|nr:xanthine dehydrogenase molybdopterin binding subunit [Xanthomonadales bacterium]
MTNFKNTGQKRRKIRHVHSAIGHDSASKHVAGTAVYVDDITEPSNLLHCYFGTSPLAHARVLSMDLSAVKQYPGVVRTMTAADIPGDNEISPMHKFDEPVLAENLVQFEGQPLFAVVAKSRTIARRAAQLARVEYEELPAILDIETALAKKSFVLDPHILQRGEPQTAITAAPHRLKGEVFTGGQDHFYLEGQVSMAIPNEDGDMLILTSSQHPSEVQHLVARSLGKPINAVTVEVRRIGGAFGGKETQAAQWAIITAVMANMTGRPVKLRLDRDDDMRSTGKRHDFQIRYDAGFDDEGRILGIEFIHALRCGISSDLSGPIADRAMFHSDNAYYLPNISITSFRCKTNTVSNTAFRGFGGPQGMVGIERVIDAIAQQLGKDPLTIRKANLYGVDKRNITPYKMVIRDNVLPGLISELEASSRYKERRQEIFAFNRNSPVIRKGIAFTPAKFGISFTTTFLNQAAALVHVYKDGSVHLNHGGTEMGQGLMIKIAQVVAEEFQIDLDRVKISATNTGKVPNTSATAASSGTDMNGMAARAASRKIKKRLLKFASKKFDVAAAEFQFINNRVKAGDIDISFAELAEQAWLGRISLSATGFYKTPKIHYDPQTSSGRPFLYFAYGAAVSEVEVDCLTGESQITRVDILYDAGKSLNPAIDIGQIEGGFVQGAGWLTSEEVWWDTEGRLRTHAPSTYKIPTCGDIPTVFNVCLWDKGRNREKTIHRSKAVGEPPLMLAISVHSAINQVIAEKLGGKTLPSLNTPATPEAILNCLYADK